MLQIKEFRTDDGLVSYAEGPESGPPVVLMHGITDAWQCFMPVIPTLLPRWQVYALDLRGHGASEHTPGDYTLTAYASDVVGFLEQVVREPVAIYGHSLGGMVGILIAAHHPELVRGLIVGDSILYRDSAEDAARKMGASWKAWRDRLARGLTAEELASESISRAPGRPASRNVLLAQTNAVVDPAVLDMLIDCRFDDYDCARLFPTIRCQVALLQSEAMAKADVERALQDLPTAYAMHFEGVGHGLHMMPDGTRAILAVQQFLEGMI
jgi:pimeloyl-ACP methyl ester carboxylesterase